MPPGRCTVAIVGGGPAGLALAAGLRRLGVEQVVVLEREAEAGGVPRHCGHFPFGLREYGRLLKGPAYARRNVDQARSLGASLYTATTVTKLLPGGRLELTTPEGLAEIEAKRVVLSTGVREASRAQRFIGGERPNGVLTTGALQSLVYLKGQRPFSRPIILGSELVSLSAIGTCRHLGIRPVAMVEEEERMIARRIFRPYLTSCGVDLVTGARSPRIIGGDRVEAVEFTDHTNKTVRIEADGVVISGRFRPEAALLRMSHLEVDPGTGGPIIDQYGQCSDPAYYSAGNLLRPAETAGWCWREGVATAKRIAEDLADPDARDRSSVRIRSADPAIRFALPQRLTFSGRPGGMENLQLGLEVPARGMLTARFGEGQAALGRVNARPVRRVLVPLERLLHDQPITDVDLSIESEM